MFELAKGFELKVYLESADIRHEPQEGVRP
jgi:hypothetical protein